MNRALLLSIGICAVCATSPTRAMQGARRFFPLVKHVGSALPPAHITSTRPFEQAVQQLMAAGYPQEVAEATIQDMASEDTKLSRLGIMAPGEFFMRRLDRLTKSQKN